MAIEKKPIQANLIGGSVPKASLYKVQDNEALDGLIKELDKISIKQEEVEISGIENQLDIFFNYENTKYSDPMLYKDENKLKQAEEQSHQGYQDLATKIANAGIKQENRDKLLWKLTKNTSYTGNRKNAMYKAEKDNQYTAQIFSDYYTATNNGIDAAFNTGNEEAIKEIVKTMQYDLGILLDRGAITPQQYNEMFASSTSNIIVLGHMKAKSDEIINNAKLSVDEKIAQLDILKKNMNDPEYLQSLGMAGARDENIDEAILINAVKTTAPGLSNYIDTHINKLSNNNYNEWQSTDGKSADVKTEMINLASAGDLYGSQKTAYESQNMAFGFSDRDSFYKNENVQKNGYGMLLDLDNENASFAPSNIMPSDFVNNISTRLSETASFNGMSDEQYKELTAEKQFDFTISNLFTNVNQTLGSDSQLRSAKYLSGSKNQFNKAFINIKGIPTLITPALEYGSLKTFVDDGTVTTNSNWRKDRERSLAIVNGQVPYLYNAINTVKTGMQADTKTNKGQDAKQVAMATATQLKNSGISLPRTAILGENKTIIPNGYLSVSSSTFNKIVEPMIDREIEMLGLTGYEAKIKKVNAINTLKYYFNSPLGQAWTEVAITSIFNTSDKVTPIYKSEANANGYTWQMIKNIGLEEDVLKFLVSQAVGTDKTRERQLIKRQGGYR